LEYNEAVYQRCIDFKKIYDSVRREVLCNIKLVSLIKLCVTEMHSRVRVGKNLSDMFPVKTSLKQREALLPLLFNSALEYAIMRVEIKRYTSASGLC
jgi:hypothetical protein